MTNNQRHSIVFWPSIKDQAENNNRELRRDSIKNVNAFVNSEENLVDKEYGYFAEKQQPHFSSEWYT
ncbi:hypothetical protein PGB90_009128 [Kerria lacca]